MAFTAKAVVHQDRSSKIEVKEFKIPETLTSNQIVIKTEYASINPVDVKLHSFTFRKRDFHTLKDFAGEVVAAGTLARVRFPVGTKVFGSISRPSDDDYVGSYTLADIEKDSIGRLPATLSFEQGAALGVAYGTAYQMLERANSYKELDANSHVLILGGATSVGTFAIELARLLYGVKNVAVTCSQRSAEYVTSYGATKTVDYHSNLSEELKKVVKSQGVKFDTILDCVGGYDALKVFPDILKPSKEGSTYISVMGDSPPQKTYGATLKSALVSMPRVAFRLVFGRCYGINYSLILLSRGKWTDDANEIFNIPNMRVPIDSVSPLEDVRAAWNKVDSTKARGKVIVKMQ